MRLRLFFLLFALAAFPLAAHAQKRPSDTTTAIRKTEDTVYITRSGKKYHRAGCPSLKKSSIPIPLAIAKKYYEPCKHCKPPE